MTDDEKQLAKVAAEAAFKPFANLAERLFGGVVDELGGTWQDRLAIRRQVRRIALFKHLQKKIDEAGFDPRGIPDAVWIPALQQASLEDDESLQEIWANLLANAADPRQERPVLASFHDVLKNLTSKDAAFLTGVYKFAEDAANRSTPGTSLIPEISMHGGDLVETYAACGLSRLQKLYPLTQKEMNDGGSDYEADMNEFRFTLSVAIWNGILTEKAVPATINTKVIERALTSTTKMGVATPLRVGVEVSYLFTEFGAAFVRACQPPTK
jgi:abortive infection alpha-like protein